MTTDLAGILNDAIQGGYVAHLTQPTYTITEPIVIHVTSTVQGALGIDGGGATFVSQVTNGQPLIQIVVDPGVDLRYLTLSNFTVAGNGQEGDGISIVCPTNDSWVYNWTISNVTVEHVGGFGLNVQGSAFEGVVCDSWMNDNGLGGARFAHDEQGGFASALRWFGGGCEDNGGAGLLLDDGARDMSVEGATFANNAGVGISAEWGITSVTASEFVDNGGVGVWFQNYGGFNNNSFATSGCQTIGIDGYLAGNATLIGNHSTYTGSGADPTILADVQGNGGLFFCGDGEDVITGANVLVSNEGGGNLAHVVVNTLGVPLRSPPTFSPPPESSAPDGSEPDPLDSALRAAIADGTVARLTDQIAYTATAPIVITITSSSQAAMGIDLGGAKIFSQITGGGPVIEIIVAPGVDVGNLTLSNFSIFGNGGEGAGIRIIADGADSSLHLMLSQVNIEHIGGVGLEVRGNVQGTVFDSWMHGNVGGGARFTGGDIDIDWTGGGFRKNGIAGLILDNGAHEVIVKGAYFVENTGPGIDARSGIDLVRNSGFENNQLAGAIVIGEASFVDNTFSTHGPQNVGVGGYLAGETITLIGDSNEYYGAGTDRTVLANVQGTGTLAIAGSGNVIAGPDISVTGAMPIVTEPAAAPPSIPAPTGPLPPEAGDDDPAPVVTLGLVHDSGASSSDAVTAVATLTGTADANAVVRFAIDGAPTDAIAIADATGHWSFAPTGLADGLHTILASQIDATGATEFSFTLDTAAPTALITGAVLADGQVTLTGTTGTAHDTISIYDGYTWLGFATTDSDGTWTFTAAADPNAVHSYGINATDLAGNEGHGTTGYNPVEMAPVVSLGLLSDTGASSSDAITAVATLTGTASAGALVHFTIDGAAVAASATADGDGHWSFTPSDLADGLHTVLAGEADGGTAAFGFRLDTEAPIPLFTDGVLVDGQATLRGTTGGANDTLSIYDGDTWLGFTTTGSDGTWTFTTAAAPDVVHSYGANATDLAGNEGHGTGKLLLGGGSGADHFIDTAAADSVSAADMQILLQGVDLGFASILG